MVQKEVGVLFAHISQVQINIEEKDMPIFDPILRKLADGLVSSIEEPAKIRIIGGVRFTIVHLTRIKIEKENYILIR